MDTLYIPRPRLEEPFVQMLESDEEPRVLSLHSTIGGKEIGGMGKTRLLQRYIKICKEKRRIQYTDLLDFRLTDKQFRTAVVQHVAELDPDRSRGAFADYWKLRDQYVGVKSRIGREAWEIGFRDLEEQMDNAWLAGFSELLARGQVCVFLDTWEAVAGTGGLELWLRQKLRRLKDFQNLTLVIAGRPPVEWSGFPVRVVEVGPFTLEETKSYAEARGYVEKGKPVSTLVEKVHQASGGHPVLVAWAFDYRDKGFAIEKIARECEGDIEAFCRRLVEETHPEMDPTLARSACLHRRFNVPILQHITDWDTDECRRKIQELREGHPSIVRRGADPGSCEPHDAARDMLIEFAWENMLDPSGDERKRLREQVIQYYTWEIQKGPPNPTELRTCHAYMAERMFYLFENCIREEKLQSCLSQVFNERFVPDFNPALSSYLSPAINLFTSESNARWCNNLPYTFLEQLHRQRPKLRSCRRSSHTL